MNFSIHFYLRISVAALVLLSGPVLAQTLVESMRPAQWRTLIFVSTKMPRESLINLARQAQRTRATLVLNGFEAGHVGMGEAQQWVGQINRDCCGVSGGAAFEIDPKKFQQYAVKSVPAFVITNPLPEIPPATLRTLVPPTVHDWFAVRAIGRPESKVTAPPPHLPPSLRRTRCWGRIIRR